MDNQTPPVQPGLVTGLLNLGKNLLSLIINRIELAGLELSGIGANVVKFLVVFMLAITALWFAIAFWAVLVVFLAWEAWGWKILLLLGAFFTIGTIALAAYARSLLKHGRLALPATMAELRKDRDALL